MNLFDKREVSVILAEHDNFSSDSSIPKVPSYADYVLHVLLGVSLAEDFQVVDRKFLEDENQEVSAISNSFTSKWIIFALTGQGDYWVLDKTQNRVGFYDHNKEDFSIYNIQELGITLEEWIVLGDLFHQYDLLNEFNPLAFNEDYTLKQEYKLDFIDKVNSINKGLFEIMPFNTIQV